MEISSDNADADSVTNFCKPCLRDKMYSPESFYCRECSEMLCSDCKNHHFKNKQTTSHTVVDIKSDLRQARRLNFVKNLAKCKNHPLEEVKYLCKDHDQLCCNECAILVHRQCHSLLSLRDFITSGFQNSYDQNLKAMEEHVENMKKHEANQSQRVNNCELMIKDQLVCIKAEFDQIFRIFEENTLHAVKSENSVLRNSISSQQMSINKFEESLRFSKEKIESVEQYGHDLHKYLLEREMEEEMVQNEQVLRRLQQTTNHSKVSMAGVQTVSKQLITCLKQNLSVIVHDNTSALPIFPTLKQHRNTVFSHKGKRGFAVDRCGKGVNSKGKGYWQGLQ